MADFRGNLHRVFAVCLAITGALGALYALSLVATAVTGNSSPSGILLGVFGFILLILSVLLLVFAVKEWKSGRPPRETEDHVRHSGTN